MAGLPVKTPAPNQGGNFEVPPAENHPAVIVAVVDLGTHTEVFEDEKTHAETERDYRKVYLAFELAGCRKSGSTENHVLARDYRLTFGERAALRALVQTLSGLTFKEGDEFDVMKLLGRPCLVEVQHQESKKGKTFARIKAVTKLPKGMPRPEADFEPYAWTFEDGTDPSPPSWLPWIYDRSVAGPAPAVDVIRRSAEAKRQRAASSPAKAASDPGEFENLSGDAGGGPPEAESEIPW